MPNRTFQISDILCLRPDRKFDASVGFVAFFWMDMFKVVAFEKGEVMEDPHCNLLQRIGTVLNSCRIELA